MYIDDCLKGTQMILASDILEPINLGSDESVTINQLVDIVEDIAGIKLKRRYNLSAPKGVNGRNSDNTLITAASRLGARDHGCATAWRRPTAGFTTRSSRTEHRGVSRKPSRAPDVED